MSCFRELAHHADELCVIRSMHTEGSAHGEALLRLHTGQANLVRPSVGAWISYGLGSENENLPAFVTISPPRGHGGVQNYGSAFLPAKHQGTAIGSAEIPISQAAVSNLSNSRHSRPAQRRQLDLVQSLNREHLRTLWIRFDRRGPDRQLRIGLPDAVGGSRSDGHRFGIKGDPAFVRHW